MIGEGLATILGLLRALLEDRAKDLLRGKTSDAKAKSLSFGLYNQIQVVTDQSGDYVKSLGDLGKALRQHASAPGRGSKDFMETLEGSDIVEKASAVNCSVGVLAARLADLQEITNAMRTQVAIHTPDLLDKRGSRTKACRCPADPRTSRGVLDGVAGFP